MKKILFIITILFISGTVFSQQFANNVTTAKSAYKAGKLEEAHFALQQAMQQVDMIIGKEVLKLLPAKMDTMAIDANDDNVSSNVGFVGATIHRSYGRAARKADLSIISNSPMVAMLNSFLSSPLLAGVSDGNTKTIKIQGYKARLEKRSGDDGKNDYELQVPLGSALITFTVNNTTESEITAMANTLPLAQIAKLIQ